MLNVQQVRLRFISARLLTSVPSISKGLRKGASTVPLFSKALAGGYLFVAAHKLILNTSAPPRMAGKLNRSDILACQNSLLIVVQGSTTINIGAASDKDVGGAKTVTMFCVHAKLAVICCTRTYSR